MPTRNDRHLTVCLPDTPDLVHVGELPANVDRPLLPDLPRGTYAVLDGAGHGVEEEQQGLFRSLASDWLDRVEAWASSAESHPAAG